MGLDIGFYRNKKEIFYLRNHNEFLSLFDEEIGGRVRDEYDDFYITLDTINVAAYRLAWLFIYCKVAASKALNEIPDSLYELDAREEDLAHLICYYPAIVELLRSEVMKHGPLICGWSA
ncbi:hypothetical protein [uncultured Sulfitobacter sp.]|uniref:hypothetical protein n=1 Tax=Sulfitobacter sp. SH22 TaxID=3421172 RepID=UPI0025E4E6BB|nr:hypothetical protein [uncultured Sulfitobacter sp.]